MKLTLNDSFKTPAGRTSVEVRAETITVELDEKKLGEGPAAAIATAIRRGIATVIARAHTGKQRWNRTGRLRDGIRAVLLGDAYDIVAPADRLQADGMAEQLAEDVRAVREPLAEPDVQKAIAKAAEEIHTKGRR